MQCKLIFSQPWRLGAHDQGVRRFGFPEATLLSLQMVALLLVLTRSFSSVHTCPQGLSVHPNFLL